MFQKHLIELSERALPRLIAAPLSSSININPKQTNRVVEIIKPAFLALLDIRQNFLTQGHCMISKSQIQSRIIQESLNQLSKLLSQGLRVLFKIRLQNSDLNDIRFQQLHEKRQVINRPRIWYLSVERILDSPHKITEMHSIPRNIFTQTLKSIQVP